MAKIEPFEKFTIVEVNEEKILNEYQLDPPKHQPGVYPKFLADNGVNIIIAGGIGSDAYRLFQKNNIEVFIGICLEKPKHLVKSYLNGELKNDKNICEYL